jgi:hypothetical protein
MNPTNPKTVRNPQVKYMMSLVLMTVQKVIKILPTSPKIAKPKIIP